jgi:hypothetical protein
VETVAIEGHWNSASIRDALDRFTFTEYDIG